MESAGRARSNLETLPGSRDCAARGGFLCEAAARVVAVVLMLTGLPAFAEVFSGTVVHVADGDSLTVLVDGACREVRLSGVDAPEKSQPYANASRANLSRLLADKEVRVEGRTIDRYGRVVGTVWVQSPDCPSCGKNLDVGLAQLTVGLAWWYRRFAAEQTPEDQGQYEFAEFEAKAKHAGLWQEADPVPPWDFRQDKRAVEAPKPGPKRDPAPKSDVATFRCGTKAYCREMASCAEARYFLAHCGLSGMDGDGDGVPCEAICP